MSHEPLTIHNRVIHEWYVVLSKNSTNSKIQIIHYRRNKIEMRIFHHYIENLDYNEVHKVMLTFEKNTHNQISSIWQRFMTYLAFAGPLLLVT